MGDDSAPDTTLEVPGAPRPPQVPWAIRRSAFRRMEMPALEERSAKLEMRVRRRAGTDRLGEQLVEEGLVSEADLARALAHQKSTGRRIGEALFELGLISSPDLARVLAQRRGIAFADLDETGVDVDVARMLPVATALNRGILLVGADGDALVLAMVNPEDGDALASVRSVTGRAVRAVMCDPAGLLSAVDEVWGSPVLPPPAKAADAGSIAASIRRYREAEAALDDDHTALTTAEVAALRKQMLGSAAALIDFLHPSAECDGGTVAATSFVAGWPGELPRLTEALERLAAQRVWLHAASGADAAGPEVSAPSPARVADLRRDLERVLFAYLGCLTPGQRSWFTGD